MKYQSKSPSLLLEGLLVSLLLLVGCSRSETARLAGRLTALPPLEMAGGNLTGAELSEDSLLLRLTVSVTNPDYDFAVLNSHPDEARQIRIWQLAMYPEHTHLGALLGAAAKEGFSAEIVYKGAGGENRVSLAGADLQQVARLSTVESHHLLNIRTTLAYVNFSLPRTIDNYTVQDCAFFDDGTVVIHFTLDEKIIDWRRVLAGEQALRQELHEVLAADARTNPGQRTIFNQCLAGRFSFAYEYEGSATPAHKLRITFTPEEIKRMLISPDRLQ